VNSDFRATKLYRAVLAARTRLRDIEEKHERMLGEGVPNHLGIGREYAAAVQDYTNAVMAWLSALETQGSGGELVAAPEDAEEASTDESPAEA
jgi:hypothetical protein